MQLESFLENSAARVPRKTAIVRGERRMTYAELDAAANRLAHALIDRGVCRGDRVAIHLENSIETVVSIFAVLKAGGVFLVVNPTTKCEKLAYILNDCRAVALIASASKLLDMSAAAEETPTIKVVISVGESTGTAAISGAISLEFEALLDEYASSASPPEKQAIDIDLAALVYTSGSTGNPKGVMLTHRNMVAAATSITTYLRNTADDVILSVLPLAFDYGLYQVLMSVKFGGTVILERSFAYPHAVMKSLVSERVTGFPIVPTMLAFLLKIDLSRYDLSRLRYISNTGAALPVDHIARFRKLVPHVRVFSMYGLTECKRVAYLPPEEIDERPGSVGRAMPNTEVFLVDDDGRKLELGSTGELVVRGSNVMPGYWERPEETAQALKPGWLPGEQVLYTGDVFRTDADGYLYFVGRKDDIIKSRGEKVSPKEVENALCCHAAISEAAVLGVADEVLGQAIRGFVTLRDDAQTTQRDVLRHCAQRLEDFMVPQSIEFLPSLPKTSNGKIDRLQLKKMLEEAGQPACV
jgi:long-chain acyl-CoA synthetase